MWSPTPTTNPTVVPSIPVSLYLLPVPTSSGNLTSMSNGGPSFTVNLSFTLGENRYQQKCLDLPFTGLVESPLAVPSQNSLRRIT